MQSPNVFGKDSYQDEQSVRREFLVFSGDMQMNAKDRFWALMPLNMDCSLLRGNVISVKDIQIIADSLGQILTIFAGIVVLSPLLEVKVATALLLCDCAEAYSLIRVRLVELNEKPPNRPTNDPVTARFWTPLSELERVELPALMQHVEAILKAADQLGEWSTRRLLITRILPSLHTWCEVLRRLRIQFGSTANRFAEMGVRDERYSVFDNTRDYRLRDSDLGLTSENPSFLELLGQLRTQRDELDAIETFARIVAAEPRLDHTEILILSKIVGDEARHVLIGELGLSDLGQDPYVIPIGVIGALLRRELSPIDALLQISAIGEAGNINEIDRSANLAESLGHVEIGKQLRLVHRDEVFHLKSGQEILERLLPTKTRSERAYIALDLTNKYLAAKGLPAMSIRQVAKLLGE